MMMKDKPIRLLKSLGGQRYREYYSMYFDDFICGDIYEHSPGRTVTEADCYWQTHLQGNPHPLHFNNDFAAETEFGRVVVSSLVTFPIIHAMSVASTSVNAVANLGWGNITLSAPVFVGDTLYAETEVITKRLSRTRPKQGIVTVCTRGFKSNREQIISFERSFLIAQRVIE